VCAACPTPRLNQSYELRPTWEQHLRYVPHRVRNRYNKWTRGPGTPPAVKGLIWYTDGSRTVEGNGAGVYGQSGNRRLSIPLGKHATVNQAEVYAILASVQESGTQDQPEKPL